MFRRSSLSCVGLLAGLALGADPGVVALNESGIRHLTASRTEAAVREFSAALGKDGRSEILRRNAAWALHLEAGRLYDADRREDALALMERAHALHPTRIRFRLERARLRVALGGEGDLVYAREDLDHVLDRDPDHFDALVLLGRLDYDARRLQSAVDAWSRAQGLDPGNAGLVERLRRAQRELKVERAFQELRTRNFLLRYSPTVTREEAEATLKICSDAYARLCPMFDHYPEKPTVVTLYSPSEFRTATQTHRWVGGLSDGTIRIALGRRGDRLGSIRRTLFHEYAHHLIRGVARGVPRWLHEGLAQHAEGRDAAEALRRLRRSWPPRFEELRVSVLRTGNAASAQRFYDLTLVYCEHLRRLGGDRGIHELLRKIGERIKEGRALREVYGEAPEQLFAAWIATQR